MKKLLCLTLVFLAHAGAQSKPPAKMTPELQKEVIKTIQEQGKMTVQTTNEAGLLRLIAQTKVDILGVSDALSNPVAQALVNQTPKRVKITIATGKANYNKSPLFKQLSKYGIRTVVLSKANFDTDILVLDSTTAVYVVKNKITVIQGHYVNSIKQVLETTLQSAK